MQREPGEPAASVLLTLKATARMYDLRERNSLGTAKSLELTIDTVVPTLFSVLAAPGPAAER